MKKIKQFIGHKDKTANGGYHTTRVEEPEQQILNQQQQMQQGFQTGT